MSVFEFHEYYVNSSHVDMQFGWNFHPDIRFRKKARPVLKLSSPLYKEIDFSFIKF